MASFSPLGVRTTEVQAVSRQRPHLNKLAQLRSDFLRDADLAVLCDCDTFFVADPRPYFAKNMVAAAVVDSPNPPIEIWDILLQRAGLTRRRPDIAVGSAAAMTIFENRNGGLYVLPGARLGELDEPWSKWAQWLEAQADVLGVYTFYIDQIAFALTCLELCIEPDLLPKALNFPTHLAAADIGDGAPIMLHYHRQVDDSGMLQPLGQLTVDRAVAFVNESLAKPAAIRRKRRLLLHVGLPKTGTSSLQRWCYANSDRFLEQSIRYPTPSADTAQPKHQFMVSDLMAGDLSRTAQAVAEGSEESTVLTTEGLTNHLYDFRPIGLEKIRGLFEAFHLTVFLVHRKPEDWLRSYHKQCAINPRNAEFYYGTGLDLQAFRELPRVRKLMNVPNLAQDCAAAFGAKEVVTMEYDSDWLVRFLGLCGYTPTEKVELEVTNESVPDWLFEGVLRINRQPFSDNARIAWLGTLQRFANSRHAGLRKHEATANSHDLWRELDPNLIDRIASPDARWAGYRELLANWAGAKAPGGRRAWSAPRFGQLRDGKMPSSAMHHIRVR
ncbi:hypothetical protein [Methylocystis sp.]|uniref:hypothetical protein n=1 Tax=Methylocystis sp. TaxID=1911079 RepID=UPI0025EFE8CE|nr:hypothetical protein [Methylocystis sp.]